MNFYTLTFKKKVILSFVLLGLSIVLLDIALEIYADSKTTKDSFINEKSSKLKHFRLNDTHDRDIVFIGSSTTYYHVSTNSFKQEGKDIYNLGLSGAEFEDYATLVNAVIGSQPKKIVISIPVSKLYERLAISSYPTLDEIKIYYKIDKIKFIDALITWLVNRHTFLTYSENIYYSIKSFYGKFNILNKISTKKSINLGYKQNENYIDKIDCTPFDIRHMDNNKKITIKCTNGDGVLIGGYKVLVHDKKILNKIDNDSIQYLKEIMKTIKDNNIEVTMILEPLSHNPYTYNLEEIKNIFKDINIEIKDLTNYFLPDKFWIDNKHLNTEGRSKYSEYLIKIL